MPRLNPNEFSSFSFESEQEADMAVQFTYLNFCFFQNLLHAAVQDKLALTPMEEKRDIREAYIQGKIEILQQIIDTARQYSNNLQEL